MLISSLREEMESVFVDILTHADLQALKSRRWAEQGGMRGSSAGTGNDKRYLILTSAVHSDNRYT